MSMRILIVLALSCQLLVAAARVDPVLRAKILMFLGGFETLLKHGPHQAYNWWRAWWLLSRMTLEELHQACWALEAELERRQHEEVAT